MKHMQCRLFALILLLVVNSCGSTIALYDQYAYTQSTALKVDALNLMDLAVDPIQIHQEKAYQVETALAKMKEYEQHRPKNTVTFTMWQTLLDTTQGSFGGFMKRWKNDSKENEGLGKAFIENRKIQISRDFDQIIELEAKKIK